MPFKAKLIFIAALAATRLAATPAFTTALNLGAAGAVARKLPTYELFGFPITPHQISVLGSPHVQEQSPTPNLMLNGMPASPHQITVLAPAERRDELVKTKIDSKKSEVH